MDRQTLEANGFTAAPSWSIIVGQLGSFFVIGGAILFLLAIAAMATKRERLGRISFIGGCATIAGAFISLATLFVTDQFAFDYVANHSWKNLHFGYKVAAVWSGQQGSFLLWALSAAIFGVLVLPKTGVFQRWYVLIYSVFLAGLCGILAYETPFNLIKDLLVGGVQFVPPDGAGLTPSLQNYWVIIHPPTIFLGFGSLTVPFALAVAAMLNRDPKGWIPIVRPWSLVSLAILGVGLVMGGLWAYETQGWGGFWAWDPVENVSFVPWLFIVAFIHGLIVQTTRSRWHGTNFLMAGLPFLTFVYGTFLTRSGFLSKFSVHSFAEMNRSALWILLGLLIGMAAFFVGLWSTAGRSLARKTDAKKADEGFNRETGYSYGVILLTALSTAIAIGMSIPFFVGLGGGDGKVVEEPLYHSVVVWFFAPIMLLIGAVPFLAWRRPRDRAVSEVRSVPVWSRLLNVFGITIGILGLTMMALKFPTMMDWSLHAHDLKPIDFPFGLHVPRFSWVIFLFGLTVFAAVGNAWRFGELVRSSKMGVGGFLSHFGVAVAMAGLILSRGLEMKGQLLTTQGFPGSALGYTVTYDGMTSDPATDRDNQLKFTVNSGKGSKSFLATPGFFFTPGEDGPKTFVWPHVEHALTHDVYMALAEPVTFLWPEAQVLQKGETKTEKDIGVAVKYEGFTRKGEAGQADTHFVARIRVTEGGKEYVSEPQFGVDGTVVPVPASPSFNAAFTGMDAATGAARIELLYKNPIYPIEIYYKPMTLLVWIGTGILFVGGMLSAFYRRQKRVPPPAKESESENVEENENALVPTA